MAARTPPEMKLALAEKHILRAVCSKVMLQLGLKKAHQSGIKEIDVLGLQKDHQDCNNSSAKYFAVKDFFLYFLTTSSGVPVAMIIPPFFPPSGPTSMT